MIDLTHVSGRLGSRSASWPHYSISEISTWVIRSKINCWWSARTSVILIPAPGGAALSRGASSLVLVVGRPSLLAVGRVTSHFVHPILVDTHSRVMVLVVSPMPLISIQFHFIIQRLDLVVGFKHFPFRFIFLFGLPILVGDSLSCSCDRESVCIETLSAHFL